MFSQDSLEYIAKAVGNHRRIPAEWRWKIWREPESARFPGSPEGWYIGRSRAVPIAFTDTYTEAWDTVDYLIERDGSRRAHHGTR